MNTAGGPTYAALVSPGPPRVIWNLSNNGASNIPPHWTLDVSHAGLVRTVSLAYLKIMLGFAFLKRREDGDSGDKRSWVEDEGRAVRISRA